jgi:hypothetical protein
MPLSSNPKFEYRNSKQIRISNFQNPNLDELVKSHRAPFAVIPAEAGIHYLRAVANHLDSGFRRSDNFLRARHAFDRSNLVLVSDFEFRVSKLPRPHRFTNIWIE